MRLDQRVFSLNGKLHKLKVKGLLTANKQNTIQALSSTQDYKMIDQSPIKSIVVNRYKSIDSSKNASQLKGTVAT